MDGCRRGGHPGSSVGASRSGRRHDRKPLATGPPRRDARARIQPDDRIRPGSAHPDWGCPVL